MRLLEIVWVLLIVLIVGSYLVEDRLGYGGMAWIYLPCILILVGSYMIKDEIKYQLAKKIAATLPAGKKKFLEEKWYLWSMIPAGRIDEFYHRVYVHTLANAFRLSSKSERPVPDDIVLLTAASCVWIDMLVEHETKDRVYVYYLHPFVSPQYPYMHIEECFEEDRTMIFSLDHARSGVVDANQYVDILLYCHLGLWMEREFCKCRLSHWIRHSRDIYKSYLMHPSHQGINWSALFVVRSIIEQDNMNWDELKLLFRELALQKA